MELASGVDSFYLSGRGRLNEALLADLDRSRDAARETRTPQDFDAGGETFQVAARSLNRYPYRLDHENGVVGLTASAHLPTVNVQPSAAFIHAAGVESALNWFMGTLEMLLGQVVWSSSRVDVFTDVQGWPLTSEDRGRFVCRARQLTMWESDSTFQTMRFGTGKSGVMARIYDKSEESRVKGTDWWPDVWGDPYRAGERVLRVEFQVTREVLAQTAIDDPVEALERLPRLWAYLTDEWLSLRTPTADQTRSRWPIAPEWQDIQEASLRNGAIGLERMRAGHRAGSIRRLLPATRGYLAAVGALGGAQSLAEALRVVGREITLQDEAGRHSFDVQLASKRLAFGL
ncbi:hypothetical protein [Nocardioides mangrovi]|uniref:Replication initiation factor domain-containing protein n=1 Tax=Nocardioides mangrovi TaxID=2874580 RepID=A0ABS7UH46_9ACTN|nr:hypothetical protein [Nocardioides mangrovi]MBZ5740335.1 hypothetical protein [Nocardioides mangrovi]